MPGSGVIGALKGAIKGTFGGEGGGGGGGGNPPPPVGW